MLSLLKRKSDASSRPAMPTWHPNFRDYQKLPDVKVVRTAFFINGASVAVLLSLAIYFGFQEWQLHVLRAQIDTAQQQIDRDKKPSDQAVALFKKFQAEEVKVTEVEAFVKSKPVVSTMLLRIARTLPENIALDSFDLRETGLYLKLTVRGSPEVAAGYATSFLDQLRADETLTALDHNRFEFVSQARDQNTGRLAVEFVLRLKGQPAEKH